jgi:hypothetical protein
LYVGESVQPLIVVGDMLLCARRKEILMWDIKKLNVHKPCWIDDDKENAVGGVLDVDGYISDEDEFEV